MINAGSSAGSEDYTYQAVAALGEVLVHGVAMMPGKPTLLGVVAGKPVIGNPGYPVSAVLSFEEFAAAPDRRLGGPAPGPPPYPAGAPGPESALQTGAHRVHPGDPGPGGRQGHGHAAAPGRGHHHLPGAGRRSAENSGLKRRPGRGPAGGGRASGPPGGHRGHPGGPGEPRQHPGPVGHPAPPPGPPAAPVFRARGQPRGAHGPAPGPGPPGGLPPVRPGDQLLQRALSSRNIWPACP
jgi:hypothetical protein